MSCKCIKKDVFLYDKSILCSNMSTSLFAYQKDLESENVNCM